MSFSALEPSIFGGKPMELFEFFLLGQYWRYTTEDRNVMFNSAEYVPCAGIRHSKIPITQNIERSELTIDMRGDTPLALEYIPGAPSEPVAVRIYQKHRGDTDYVRRWSGKVQTCIWSSDGALATLHCTQTNWSLRQPGLRRTFQAPCPHDLYGNGCNVIETSYEVLGTVTGVSGLTVTVTLPGSYAANYFAGGYLLWESVTGRQDRRMITASSGSSITVQLTTIGLSVGDHVRLYPGCDHSPQTCFSKFNNINNYGGTCLFLSDKNPFAGATIF